VSDVEGRVAVEVVVGDIAVKELKHHAPPLVVAVIIAFVANSVPVHPAPGQQKSALFDDAPPNVLAPV